jgi:hypothetical protein
MMGSQAAHCSGRQGGRRLWSAPPEGPASPTHEMPRSQRKEIGPLARWYRKGSHLLFQRPRRQQVQAGAQLLVGEIGVGPRPRARAARHAGHINTVIRSSTGVNGLPRLPQNRSDPPPRFPAKADVRSQATVDGRTRAGLASQYEIMAKGGAMSRTQGRSHHYSLVEDRRKASTRLNDPAVSVRRYRYETVSSPETTRSRSAPRPVLLPARGQGSAVGGQAGRVLAGGCWPASAADGSMFGSPRGSTR